MANKDYKAFIVEGEVREPSGDWTIFRRGNTGSDICHGRYRRLRDSGYLC